MSRTTSPTHHRVSVLIPARQEDAAGAACLQALQQQDVRPLEVLHLAGGRDAADADGAFDTRTVDVSGAAGRLAILARALPHVRGDVLVWLDPQCVPSQPDWIKMLVQTLNDESIAAATGRCDADGARGFARTLARSVSCLWGHGRRRPAKVDLVSLQCDAFRTSVLRELELDDEQAAPPTAEPVELSVRIGRAGYGIMFQPLARARSTRPRSTGELLLDALRYGEADAFLGRRWGIDWLHGRIFMAACLSFLLPLPAFISLPYGVIAAGLLFLWGWFSGVRIPPCPWEWPIALFNLVVYIAIVLLVRDGWACRLFPPQTWHPAMIRQMLFVIALPLSYGLILLAAGARTGARGVSDPASLLSLPLGVAAATLWHLLSGIGYARETWFPRYKNEPVSSGQRAG